MFPSTWNWLQTAWRVFHFSTDRILWNSFLAFIPLFCSIWLFRRARSRSWVWWGIFGVFLAFLPNAPYILTDIIHVISYIRQGYSTGIVILVLIPQYSLFLFAGFQAYVLSLINLEFYLRKENLKRFALPITLGMHALSAIGIYLGRFLRFNSWDLLAQPDEVFRSFEDFLEKRPFVFTLTSFLIIWGLYEFVKRIDLALFPSLLESGKRKKRPIVVRDR